MSVAVRYLSKFGRTRRIAEAIAEGAGVQAFSIDDEPVLQEYVDVLFLGGAPYANVMDPKLRAYAESILPEKVGAVVLFTTSNWSRRTVVGLRRIFTAKNIPVANEYFYSHMTKINQNLEHAKDFGKRLVEDPR
ncbi:MAG: hypothetical protein IJ863_07920 [Spirochaetales bacterium]|nr:hypothetical protein [Spirochaetales bacterium]